MNRFVIADSTVCIGCRTCEAACSETHRLHGLQSMPRLRVMRNEKESARSSVTTVKTPRARAFVLSMPSPALTARYS